jgi:hypothetical protein
MLQGLELLGLLVNLLNEVGRTELVATVGELDGHLGLCVFVLAQDDFAEPAHSQGLAHFVVVQDGAIIEVLA